MIIKTYTIPIEAATPYLVTPPGVGLILREHQRGVVASNARHVLDMGPGGSGKTTTQQARCLKEIFESNFMQRQIISAPSLVIGLQFCPPLNAPKLLRLDCTEACFDAASQTVTCNHAVSSFQVAKEYRLCDPDAEGTVSAVVDFLMRSEAEQISISEDRKTDKLILVTTHQSLIQAQRESAGTYSPRNLTLRIDEAHHSAAGGAGVAESETENQLGRLVTFICEQEGSARICMTTATPYRSNGGSLFPQQHVRDFEKFNLSLREHLAHTSIRTVVISLETFDNDPIETVMNNVEHAPEHVPFIVHPESGAKWLKGKNKLAVAAQWKARLEGLGRTVGMFIGAEQHAHKRQAVRFPMTFDAWLTCHTAREGFDAEHASWIHHTAVENSLWLSVQTFYRVIRTHPEKTIVGLTYYVPSFTAAEALRAENDFTARTAVMLIDKLASMAEPTHEVTNRPASLVKPLIGELYEATSRPDEVWENVMTALSLSLRELPEAEQLSGAHQMLLDAGISEETINSRDLSRRFVRTYRLSLQSHTQRVYPFVSGDRRESVLTIFGPSTTVDLERVERELSSKWDEMFNELRAAWTA